MRAKLLSIAAGLLAAAGGAAAWLAWPDASAQPQVNVTGCTCGRPTHLPDAANPVLAVHHCICPGMQCVITTARAAAGSPLTVEQDCLPAR